MKRIHYTRHYGVHHADLIDEIERLYTTIFQKIDVTKFHRRMHDEHLFSVLAHSENELVGFKVGYPEGEKIFYSWIGGVHPSYRNSGIGQQLMSEQHAWCRQQGFQTIRTKTMNRWRNMLILNLKNGFEITETYRDASGTLKIILEKSI